MLVPGDIIDVEFRSVKLEKMSKNFDGLMKRMLILSSENANGTVSVEE